MVLMVELICDAIDGASYMPEDCYLSVRVGGIQRLARLSALVAPSSAGNGFFRFPGGAGETGRRQGAKFEVFRRLGTASSADLEPTRDDVQKNVTVNCAAAGFGKLRIRLVVKSDVLGSKEKQQDKQEKQDEGPRKRTTAKERHAREYLAKHDLETQLSEAMQAVLRERPEDPAQLLAAKLLGYSSHSGVKASAMQFSPAPPPPAYDGRTAAMPEGRRPLYDRAVADFQPFTFSPRKPKHHFDRLEPMQRPLVPLQPPQPPHSALPCQEPEQFLSPRQVANRHVFYDYYRANCLPDIGRSAFEKLHAKCSKPRSNFEQRTRIDICPASSHTGSGGELAAAVAPSMGTWLSVRPMPLRRSGNVSQGNILHRACSNQGAKPSVGTWASLRPEPIGKVVQSSSDATLSCEKASVEGILPFRRYYQRNLAQTADRAFATLYAMFDRPRMTVNSGLQGMRSSLCLRVNMATASSVAVTQGSALVRSSDWHHTPSVGTWLARPQALELSVPGMRGYHFKPSVGTWLSLNQIHDDCSNDIVAHSTRGGTDLVGHCEGRAACVARDALCHQSPQQESSATPAEGAIAGSWLRSPSVGTWLSTPCALRPGQVTPGYAFRPSVGTWLCPCSVEARDREQDVRDPSGAAQKN